MKRWFVLIVVAAVSFTAYAQKWPFSYAEPAWRTMTARDVSDLINAGAEVDQTLFEEWTPLMCAAWNNPDPEVIRAFVERGADIEAREESGRTALMMAAKNNENPAVVEALLRAGADPTATDGPSGWNAAQHARYNDAIVSSPVYQKLLTRASPAAHAAEDPSTDFGAADLMQYSEVPSDVYVVPAFYPIGWSPEGAFAYVEDREVEGRGGTITTYTIFDVVSDTVVFQREEYDVPWEDERNRRAGAAAEFLRTVEEADIRAGDGIDFRPFPHVTHGDAYIGEVITTPEVEKNPNVPFDEIGSYAVLVHSDRLGSKRITGSRDVYAKSIWLAGYFSSPFEPRILVVIATEEWVFEGTGVFFSLSGCNLNIGFE